MQKAVLLHNIRSQYNVGSLFRTADGAGVSRVYLSGYTPAPVDRFGRVRKEIHKTALGAEQYVPWTYVRDVKKLIVSLKKEGWHIVGIEQDERARDFRSFTPNHSVVFVFGNEVRGLSKQVRALCDELIEIPMHGKKESLNVAVAAGAILFNT